jgi:hypothetical protein
VVEKIRTDVRQALTGQDVKEKFAAFGYEVLQPHARIQGLHGFREQALWRGDQEGRSGSGLIKRSIKPPLAGGFSRCPLVSRKTPDAAPGVFQEIH